MKKIGAMITLFVFFTLPLFGADGSSGCGPGWYVLKDQSLLSSFGRVITNGALAPFVTLGMTFGTSNCTKHSIVMEDKQELQFVTSHFDQLKVEIAQGHGQYLENFSSLLGCSEEASFLLSVSLQKNYSQIYSKEAPQAVLDSILNLVKQNSDLKMSCAPGRA